MTKIFAARSDRFLRAVHCRSIPGGPKHPKFDCLVIDIQLYLSVSSSQIDSTVSDRRPIRHSGGRRRRPLDRSGVARSGTRMLERAQRRGKPLHQRIALWDVALQRRRCRGALLFGAQIAADWDRPLAGSCAASGDGGLLPRFS
jgi:hypothetical protein